MFFIVYVNVDSSELPTYDIIGCCSGIQYIYNKLWLEQLQRERQLAAVVAAAAAAAR